jgi:protein-tyrosine phosphatase
MEGFMDIHNHLLFGVDDGAENIETSISMLNQAKHQNISKIILTPHYRHGMFAYPLIDVEGHFYKLKEKAENIGVKIYLGCEYHVNSEILNDINSGRVHTLAGTDYVLTEYSHSSEFAYIKEYTGKMVSAGYVPIIAHAERYGCFQKKPELIWEIKDMGAMIQINADSVLGIDGKILKKTCKMFLKNEMADFVASDSHGIKERANHMLDCCTYIRKKYGAHYAAEIFYENPEKIIDEIGETAGF